MTLLNTVLALAIATGFGGLWLYDRYGGDPAATECCDAPRTVLRLDMRTGLYMPETVRG